jgi:hypothetical protein
MESNFTGVNLFCPDSQYPTSTEKIQCCLDLCKSNVDFCFSNCKNERCREQCKEISRDCDSFCGEYPSLELEIEKKCRNASDPALCMKEMCLGKCSYAEKQIKESSLLYGDGKYGNKKSNLILYIVLLIIFIILGILVYKLKNK